jgi:glycosyltransferase involved in cell wall biosynthesis
VYTVGPAYTLGFMEALGSGLPIIAPSSNMIAKITDPEIQKEVRFSEAGGRYEIEELLENDPALIYDSIEEARIKIDWLMKNPSYREEVSVRQKTKFATMFDDKKILAQWEDILYATIDGG